MIGRALHRLARAFARPLTAAMALVLLSAVPGVAIASLPTHPAPSHDCCQASVPMTAADCERAPCCIVKPAPKSPSVTTGSAAPHALVPAEAVVLETTAAPRPAAAAASVAPRARSAPLHILLVTFLN